MSDLKINNITDRTGGSGPVIAGVSTVSTTGSFVVPVGPTEMRGGRGRGVFAGNWNPTVLNTIDYIEIATTGNAVDFGDLPIVSYMAAGCASATRGLVFPGYQGSPASYNSRIHYITISSQGGGNDFGDTLNASQNGSGACSDSTRAVRAQGSVSPLSTNLLEYCTIATTGDTSGFGDLTYLTGQMAGSFASPTRGIFAGGGPGNGTNIINYITIQTLGDV